MSKDWLVVGIAGTTCSGKTSLSKALKDHYPDAVVLNLDDFFFDVESNRHVRVPEVDHINFEILSSLDIDGFLVQIREILATTVRNKPKLLILDGFLLFNDPKIVKLCDVKFFLEVDEETCLARRSARTYGPPDPPGYFEVCVWPYSLKHCLEVKSSVQDVIYMDGTENPKDLAEKAITLLDTLVKPL